MFLSWIYVHMSCHTSHVQVGPTLGGHLTPLQCGWLAAGGVMACILYVLLLLPETLTVESKQQVSLQGASLRSFCRRCAVLCPAMPCSLQCLASASETGGLWDLCIRHERLSLAPPAHPACWFWQLHPSKLVLAIASCNSRCDRLRGTPPIGMRCRPDSHAAAWASPGRSHRCTQHGLPAGTGEQGRLCRPLQHARITCERIIVVQTVTVQQFSLQVGQGVGQGYGVVIVNLPDFVSWQWSTTMLTSKKFSLVFLQARTRLLSRRRPQGKYWKAPDWHGLTILTRNPLFLKLTLVLMLNGIVSEGLWEIMTQYLQLKLGFNTLDNVRLRYCLCRTALCGRPGILQETMLSYVVCAHRLPVCSPLMKPAPGIITRALRTVRSGSWRPG